MFALLKKDFIASRWFLIPGFPIFLINSVAVFQNTFHYLAFGIAAAVLLIMAPLLVDEKYSTQSLSYWLPRNKQTIVFARYLASATGLTVGFGIILGVGSLCASFFRETNFFIVYSPAGIAAYFLITTTMLSLFLPCYFKLGLSKGSIVFGGVLTILAIVLVGPFIEDLFKGTLLDSKYISHPEFFITMLGDNLVTAVGATMSALLIPVYIVIVAGLSMFLSAWFSARQDVGLSE